MIEERIHDRTQNDHGQRDEQIEFQAALSIEINRIAKSGEKRNPQIKWMQKDHRKHHHDDEKSKIQKGMTGGKCIVHGHSFKKALCKQSA